MNNEKERVYFLLKKSKIIKNYSLKLYTQAARRKQTKELTTVLNQSEVGICLHQLTTNQKLGFVYVSFTLVNQKHIIIDVSLKSKLAQSYLLSAKKQLRCLIINFSYSFLGPPLERRYTIDKQPLLEEQEGRKVIDCL